MNVGYLYSLLSGVRTESEAALLGQPASSVATERGVTVSGKVYASSHVLEEREKEIFGRVKS